jgi:hypothetical protein
MEVVGLTVPQPVATNNETTSPQHMNWERRMIVDLGGNEWAWNDGEISRLTYGRTQPDESCGCRFELRKVDCDGKY